MTSEAPDDAAFEASATTTLRRFTLLTFVPFIGLLMFGGAAALALRAFSHNNSLSCSDVFGSTVSGCTHYSYVAPVLLGVGGVLVLMGGGLFASYYAARKVGLPALAALRQRRNTQ